MKGGDKTDQENKQRLRLISAPLTLCVTEYPVDGPFEGIRYEVRLQVTLVQLLKRFRASGARRDEDTACSKPCSHFDIAELIAHDVEA